MPSVWYRCLSTTPECLWGYGKTDSHPKAPRTSEWQVVIKDELLQPQNTMTLTLLSWHRTKEITEKSMKVQEKMTVAHERWNVQRTHGELQSYTSCTRGRPPKSRGQRMGSVFTQGPSHRLVKLRNTKGKKLRKAGLQHSSSLSLLHSLCLDKGKVKQWPARRRGLNSAQLFGYHSIPPLNSVWQGEENPTHDNSMGI